jgi:AMP-polyphosphate phosphotransferase
MFETAEIGRTVSREEYEAEEPKLRLDLLEAQRALQKAGVPVVLLFAGADGAGKGETVKRLLEWLDARGLDAHAFGPPTDEERERPRWWRYWMRLPPRGRIGIFFGSWYSEPLTDRAFGRLGRGRFDRMLSEIAFFEQMLAADGALMVKLWIHLSKKALRRRLHRLEQDPATRWKVTQADWKHFKKYDRYIEASEEVIRRTDTSLAPWLLVEATDDRYRDLTAGRTLLERFRERLAAVERPAPAAAAAEAAAVAAASAPAQVTTARKARSAAARAHEASLTILDRVDLAAKVEPAEYEKRLDKAQGRLGKLVRAAFEKGRSSVVVFEGWDASGKGGNIRRLTAAMDPRTYRVISVAAPTDEEKAHHYLWRFWRHVPRAGYVTVYDRSWYGRVLVERVEGFARPDEWSRAYLEINDFEQQLVSHGVVLAKFWLHVDQKEQLRRFHERETVAWKAHKIGPEDWRNREKWPAYEDAVVDMIARTSTHEAPWTLVGANDKRSARIKVVETLCQRLAAALES